MIDFTHLHVHTEYSILDGMSKIPALVDKAVCDGMNAIAITDHGNMFGIKEFVDYVKTKNESLPADKQFKAIIGVEAYCARRTLYDKDKNFKKINPRTGKEQIVDQSGYHLILLAKNKKGYENLCKLVSISWIDGEYYRPRIDKNILEKYHEGLIICSACLGGEIPQLIMNGNIEAAEESIMWFKNIFGDDYYLELQRHKTNRQNADTGTYEKQRIVNAEILKLAEKHNVKIIASNDAHFINEEDADTHEHLICLNTNSYLTDQNRLRYTKQEWLKSPEEMEKLFSDIPEALSNTREIADKIESYSIDSDAIMPVFPIPEEFGTEAEYREKYSKEDLIAEFETEESNRGRIEKLGGFDKVYRIKLEADYLRRLTLKGANERYGDNIADEIMERINFELDVIKKMGFPGYFLIVQDFIQAARDMGVSVGPGRGSAAGSVVSYCLKITNINPLEYDLLFERFLNPDRISLPDIDVDFDDEGRAKVLKWVTEKYGKEKVAHIITYGTMATKSSIKDVARVQQLPLEQAEYLTKMIRSEYFSEDKDGNKPEITIKNCIELIPEFRKIAESGNEEIDKVLRFAEKLEGTVRQTGVHPCGIIIGAEDLTQFVPLSTAKDKNLNEDVIVTQYQGSVIENVGLIKIDFLGLKTLSIIRETLSNIKKTKGIDIDIENIPLDDKDTYKLFSFGQTVGIFQFESAGMQKYLRELKPTKFADLIAMNALYRPGPMQYIPSFINRKHGREKIEYDFPIMESRLKDTYGITVYQEQVMLLSRDIAGFTRGESDELRKAMGKKLKEKMDSLREKFLVGAEKNGFGPKEKLEKIWEDWAAFAKYAFNKCHAIGYSKIAYQTAYLKAHYPAEFMAAVLTNNISDIKEVSKFMEECKSIGIKVLPPSVNESDMTFTVNKDGNIRFGLAAVKGVGTTAAENIIKVRETAPFSDIFDFISRINLTAVNRRTIESLVLSGGFDEFTAIRRPQFYAKNEKDEMFIDTLIRYGNLVQIDMAGGSLSLFGDDHKANIVKPLIPFTEDWSDMETLAREKDLIGIYLSSHPLDPYKMEINLLCNVQVNDLTNLDQFKNKRICFAGIVTETKELITKKGKPFGRVTIEDYSGSYSFQRFDKDWIENKNYFTLNYFLLLRGTVIERKKFVQKDPNGNEIENNDTPTFDIRFEKIIMLHDVRKDLITELEIILPVDMIDADFIKMMNRQISKNKGDKRLSFMFFDVEKNIKIEQTSRKYKVSVSDELLNFLNESDINYRIKTI
ncbi:MAG: DNA polymerase III subunit alpha [Prevotellaceae bacterium]|jgi:DNA polymerase-3 subunit alpha|nr:DNA polymerase III subunit alpha [Prevotellaceae bacterium]